MLLILNCLSVDDLQFVTSSNQREREMIPLVTGRKCYISPWIPTVPTGQEWLDSSKFHSCDFV